MVPDPIDRQQLTRLYEQRLEADSASRVFVPLAEIYRSSGRLEDARRLLEAGLARHPEFLSARVALGQVLCELSHDGRAGDVLAQVLARDPENLLALRLRAEAAQRQEDWADAAVHLERVVQLDPADSPAAARLREVRARIETAPARSGAGARGPEPAPAEPAGSLATVTLADLYLRQGHPEKAREVLQRLASLEPGREDVRQRLEALAHDEAGRRVASPGEDPPRAARRRTSDERQEERERFAAWLKRAGEE